MHHREINRRTLLRGIGATMALPLLEAMLPTGIARGAATGAARAWNQNGEAPLRMAFFYVPNGMHMPDWIPERGGKDFPLPPILKELEEFRDRFNVLGGLTLDQARAHGDGGGDHARAVASFLTGAHPRKTNGADIRNGVSVDQVAAAQIGKRTRLPSLELGTETSSPGGHCDSGYSCVYTSNVSWRTETSPVAKEVDPAMVFDRMFSGTEMGMTPAERERRNRRRKSVLDLVHSDAQSLHHALGANDRRKLDEYLYAVREIEQRISRAETLDHGDSAMQDLARPEGVPREYGEHVRLLMDMMVLAFQTDSTRISTFMFANAGSNRSYREIGIAEGHHDLSHHGQSEEKQKRISQINRHHATMFRYFLSRMAATAEGDSNLLDNSMIVYGSAIADGNSHAHNNLPILLAGRGGGAIRTGRFLEYPNETPLTNLYLTMLHQMGIPMESFSDSTGPLEGLVG